MTPKDDPTGTRLTADLIAVLDDVHGALQQAYTSPRLAKLDAPTRTRLQDASWKVADLKKRLTAPSVSPTEPKYPRRVVPTVGDVVYCNKCDSYDDVGAFVPHCDDQECPMKTEPEAPTPEIAEIRKEYVLACKDIEEVELYRPPEADLPNEISGKIKIWDNYRGANKAVGILLRLIEARTPVVAPEQMASWLCERYSGHLDDGIAFDNRSHAGKRMWRQDALDLTKSGLLRSAPTAKQIEHVLVDFAQNPNVSYGGLASEIAQAIRDLITPHAGGK